MQTKIGIKYYELSNLPKAFGIGKLLTTVSDRKLEVSDGLSGTIAYYTADACAEQSRSIISSSDYYPFGFAMDGRDYESNNYRYGFYRKYSVGKEKDEPGMGGGGSTYDYGFRIYNPGIAKFLSVDPLFKSYPWYTPYQFAGNKPIVAIDLDGLEERLYYYEIKDGETKLQNSGTVKEGARTLGNEGEVTIIINHDKHTMSFIHSTEGGYKRVDVTMEKQGGVIGWIKGLFSDKSNDNWLSGEGGWQVGGTVYTTKSGGADPTKYRAKNPADIVDAELLIAAIGGAGAGRFKKSKLDFAKGLHKVNGIISEIKSNTNEAIEPFNPIESDNSGRLIDGTEYDINICPDGSKFYSKHKGYGSDLGPSGSDKNDTIKINDVDNDKAKSGNMKFKKEHGIER